MISINSYLDGIFEDFQDYLDKGRQLCDLKSMHFDQGQIPDYEDIHAQQYYLLRYAYGYAFEYKLMYNTLLRKYPRKKKISVTSIGCGAMLDYWALARVLEEMGKGDVSIRYTGIDLIDWSYSIPERNNDDVTFCENDAIDELEEYEQLESNVFFFPKSISEFSSSGFKRLCETFQTTPIKKDRIHLLVSVRANENSLESDLKRVEALDSAILKNGFVQVGDCNRHWWPGEEDQKKKICKIDSDFKHPGDIVDCLTELHTYCSYYQENGECCEEDCERRLSRFPILTQSQVHYAILTYERKKS